MIIQTSIITLPPKNPHPDSILWRSRYQPIGEKDDILREQSKYWGKRGVHYHQFLRAGRKYTQFKISLRTLSYYYQERGI